MKSKVLVILGPTATGKTDLGIKLAKVLGLGGELIACDSRQVYRGLDIGTGKLPGKYKTLKKEKGFWEINGVKIWMYDTVDPNTQYTVADYVQDATKVVDDIIARGKLPIIVGGTGLYLKALLEGLPNLAIPIDKKLREELEGLSLHELQEKLIQVDQKRWEEMNSSDKQNPRRLLRSIELSLMNPRLPSPVGETIGGQAYMGCRDVLKIGLNAPRQVLYGRVDSRVLSRLQDGMVEEAKLLNESGLSLDRMRGLGLEYRVLADYLEEKISSEKELVKVMQNKIHAYIRRQLTWFKKEKEANWFDIASPGWVDQVEKLVVSWYNQGK